jgi:hypothetical protein
MVRRPDAYVDLFACDAHAPTLVPPPPPAPDPDAPEPNPPPFISPQDRDALAPARRPPWRFHKR